MILAYKYRLYPTSGQHARLKAALEHSRQLYNAALEERLDCYRKTGKGRSFYDQCKALAQLRQDTGSPYASTMERAPLRALDKAYKAFFKRGGFPRFKGRERFRSIEWVERSGWDLRQGKFWAKGIGAIRVKLHRLLPEAIKAARVKREGRHWFVVLTAEVEPRQGEDRPPVGVDMGLASLAALSTGETFANPRAYRRALKRLRVKQRALARCRRGSARRRKVRSALALTHLKIRRIRETNLHTLSADLTRRFGLVAVEALNVKGLANSRLAKDVRDAGWRRLRELLRYKAELNGGQLVEVDPRYTSQTCPGCGVVSAKTLSDRVHECPCGCVLDRDVAAAKVVLHRAVRGLEALNVAGNGERAPGKVAA